MQILSPALIFLVPALPLLAGIICRLVSTPNAAKVAKAAAACSLALAAVLVFFGADGWNGWVEFDLAGRVMLLLVAFLGAVIIRFSHHYLHGDPAQNRFFSWMSLTLASVLTMVVAGHTVVFLITWVAMSQFLHRLLLHRPERAGAVFSARKKYVFSRLGDLCLLAAVLWLGQGHGAWTMDQVAQLAQSGAEVGWTGVGLLLALCAILKSAQFPFHTWLPDTMETPTPVSAFMHAGIINAGGFLVIRFSPVFDSSFAGAYSLVVIGTLSAAFGAIVMLAQPSVKRALAYSTIAQMGFMLLQCGLGAYGLALIHIVAHSLYKAHAFLTAGSTIGAMPRASIALKYSTLAFGVLVGVGMVIVGNTLLHALLPEMAEQAPVFSVVLAFSLAYGVARSTSSQAGFQIFGRVLGMAVLVTLISMILHATAGWMALDQGAAHLPNWLVIAVSAIFVGLFLFQAMHWRAHRFPLGRALYVHSLNGFYMGTLGNRLLSNLWPRHKVLNPPADS
ncbi:MAG: proton-conducting transporter membrane subunit [Akkermansiaceae bacterium]|nr:proton-conducting transporter membrane subunit [Akkermansiaceae bacterium]